MSGELKQPRLRGLIEERSQRLKEGEVLPVVSVTNHNGIQLASETFSRQVYSRELTNYKIIRPGWYAFNPSRANVGSLARNNLGREVCASPMYTVFERSSAEIDPEYLDAYLNSTRFIARVGANLQGSVRDALSFGALEAFPIHLPALPEQQAIAKVLLSAEEAIAKSEAMVANLSEAKHATMRELLTRGIRRERAPMKPLPSRWVLGRVAPDVTHIPADWDLVTLTKVAKLESGHTPSRDKAEYWGGDIPWLSLADTDALDALQVHETSECVTAKGIKNSSARILPVDTVVFSRTATVGKATRMGREMATSQDFANWVCGSALHPAYLVQVFRHMGREWDRLQEGSTHQTIYMPVFKKLQILLPSMSEQQKIAEVGEAFDLRISNERTTRDTLARNRDALAQELLSGRMRLPDSMIARHRDNPGQAA